MISKNRTLVLPVFFTLLAVAAGFFLGTFSSFGSRQVEPVYADKTDLVDMQYSFRAVAEEVLPCVVEIKVTEIKIQEMPEGYSWPFNFVEPENENAPEMNEYETQGLGSGVIVRQDGDVFYVITNNHVVGDADELTVVLHDRTEIEAELVGKDERKDIAMISFKTEKKLKPVNIGDSEKLHIGDWVLAIGSPLGYDSTVTAGIVSALGRSGPEDNISDFIQTDASINQGNSGGALVNLDGELVGINTWIATTTGVSIGLGFSIPVNNLVKAIDDLIEKGSVIYGWLGVSIAAPDQITERQMGLENKKGAFIYNVYENSPAGKSGLQPGDFITGLNNNAIKDHKHLIRLIGDFRAGEKISFDIIRQKNNMTIEAEIEQRKTKEELITLTDLLWPGFTAVMIDPDDPDLKISDNYKGVIVNVETGSKAFKAGLKNFDVITEINDEKINNILDFYRLINDKSNNYNLKIIRNSSEVIIDVSR